jgi:hypothetical protein
MKGTVHQIHVLDNLWIFKTHFKIGKDLVPMRFTLVLGNNTYTDGQEITGEIVVREGVEFVREKL